VVVIRYMVRFLVCHSEVFMVLQLVIFGKRGNSVSVIGSYQASGWKGYDYDSKDWKSE